MSKHLLAGALCLLSSSYAAAQNLPSFFNTNDIEQRLPQPNPPSQNYQPAAPAQVLPDPTTAEQPLHMQSPIAIRGVYIEGGTLYSLQDLAQAYAPLTGKTVSLGQLIEATRSITQRYHADGYPLSFAFLPEQDFASGNIRVVLVEGYISHIQLNADLGPVEKKIRAIAEPLLQERPLRKASFERYSTLLNSLPGVSIQAKVPPPTTTDGATSLIIEGQRKRLLSSMNLTSSRDENLQALLSVSTQANTAWGEQLSVAALTPPGEDKAHYLRADYRQLLGSNGSQLQLSASHYRAKPKEQYLATGFELAQDKRNNRYSVSLSHPLIAAPNQWWSIEAQLYSVDNLANYQIANLPLNFDEDAKVRGLSLATEWRKNSETQLRLLGLTAFKGFKRFGAMASSPLTDLNFFRLRANALQSDNYSPNLQGVLAATGYWSNHSLPESERALFGGQNFARGYPSDQAQGDKGWGVSYELNYSFQLDKPWLKLLQPYVVLDAAKTWYNELALNGSRLSSVATGLRFGDKRHYNLSLEAAKPMADKAIDSANRSPRYTLTFSYQL